MTPISLSTTFIQKSPGVHTGYEYSRTGNPTRDTLENCLAELENGVWGAAFASGSAATGSLMHLLSAGDEVIAFDDLYGGTYRYFTKLCTLHGIKFNFVNLSDPKAFEAAITEKTKMVWCESPTNPNLKLADIQVLSDIAHKKDQGIIVVVDNTFATPFFQNPLDHGADLTYHSITKYINGHSDVVMGAVVGRDLALKDRVKFVQNGLGAVPSAFDAFLVLRGIKTLHLRMERHQANAKAMVKLLKSHPKVEKVRYPGEDDYEQNDIFNKQMSGFGGMITFWLKGGIEQSRQFLENLKVVALAESLGGVESLIEHPAIMTHASVPAEERAKLGISDSMVRFSIGVEDIEDLKNDINTAFEAVTL
eukprot:TRINITY_DN7640_c0_g1_i1.p1 TRINITY_DN7640_c0_g1~~TRINITY_DN7640_c0_g1_i1.p1  ORF type:complete len:402 (+),score=124.95 TRINITY_DN7640_c0_g1_i1:115-1206(+)